MKKPVKKILLTVLLVLVLLFAAVFSIPYFFFGINIFDRSGWATSDAGETQYHDFYGRPLTGWQNIEDNWYYFAPDDGGMETGWLELPEGRYYLDDDGKRHIGWLAMPDGIYYIKPSNATMHTGWLELEGNTYYLDASGRRCTGWQDIEENRYLFADGGEMLTGWQESGGSRYFLTEDGSMATGWTETPEGRSYFGADGILGFGWTDTDEGRYYLDENGQITTGRVDTEEGTYFLDEMGQPITGWTETEAGKFYLDETGRMCVGWMDIEGSRYYFREDGRMARGKVIIDEVAWYFTSTGKMVYMVNTWNPVPEDYAVELVAYNGYTIAAEAYDALVRMLGAVKQYGYYTITSIYRSEATQQNIWTNRYYRYVNAGYSHQGALDRVAKEVAVPGTSEHHLGLAVDIDGVAAVHKWLAEHSWEYGFIVRYPEGKTHITGIIYEPWHYRYVGVELAKELYESGLTMEEYMDKLTEEEGSDAGTASNPANK